MVGWEGCATTTRPQGKWEEVLVTPLFNPSGKGYAFCQLWSCLDWLVFWLKVKRILHEKVGNSWTLIKNGDHSSIPF